MKNRVIAIDGPAASGKSTTARLVAERLGWLYVDTGAMYRAVTVAVIRNGIAPDDVDAVTHLAETCDVTFERSNGGQRVFLNGGDVTEEIRLPRVTAAVSKISSYEGVRHCLVARQRAMAARGSLVMDGRDIGTVVFPHADVKVFLVASLDERARRRAEELRRQGATTDIATLRAEIEERDRFDAARALSPLVKAPDAVELDTTHLTIEEQVRIILDIAAAVIGKDTNA